MHISISAVSQGRREVTRGGAGELQLRPEAGGVADCAHHDHPCAPPPPPPPSSPCVRARAHAVHAHVTVLGQSYQYSNLVHAHARKAEQPDWSHVLHTLAIKLRFCEKRACRQRMAELALCRRCPVSPASLAASRVCSRATRCFSSPPQRSSGALPHCTCRTWRAYAQIQFQSVRVWLGYFTFGQVQCQIDRLMQPVVFLIVPSQKLSAQFMSHLCYGAAKVVPSCGVWVLCHLPSCILSCCTSRMSHASHAGRSACLS